MAGQRKAKLSMFIKSIHPKENIGEDEEYIVAALVNIFKGSVRGPMPPRPREWEDGREYVEITEELYTDGTRKFISREEKVYRKVEQVGGSARGRWVR
jgi:hypothetical protein